MRSFHVLLTGALLALTTLSAGAQAPVPVNPHASREARALLAYIASISGRATLSGQHNYPNTAAHWTDRAYDLTGKYPAVYGQDFGFQGGIDKDSALARPALVAEAIRQYRNGAIVTLTWHAVRPTEDEPVAFMESIQGKLSDFEWHELLTPGTALNARWCAQVDVIAGYLRQLRDAHVPVLWRPYHEVNGSWFWWGARKGENGSAALYRMEYDRFVNRHHLDNLIWVWNANAPGDGNSGPLQYADVFPGLAYADILSVDVYGEFQQRYYDELLALAGGKPIALGEVGTVPTPDVLVKQPKYAWFMTWSEWVEEANTLEGVRALYAAPMVASRDDARVSAAMAEIRKLSPAPTPEPVTPNATAAARDLLATLHKAEGTKVLSGQDGASAAQKIGMLTGHAPAIQGLEIGVAQDALPGVVNEALSLSKAKTIVSLSWHAPRPGGGAAESKLSDFEWRELITPGTHLNQAWYDEVDALASALRPLHAAGVAVLWRPLPEGNGTRYWWAGRKGVQGSGELYRMLFRRLAVHHELQNLVWVWEALPAGYGPDSDAQYGDFFPGLLFVDALTVQLANDYPATRRDGELARYGLGKAIGFTFAGVPPAFVGERATQWSWFVATPEAAGRSDAAEGLKKLYASPRVVAANGR